MTDYFRRHLGAKLLLSYLAIIIVGVTVLIIASQFILPTSFNRHMNGMTLAPGAHLPQTQVPWSAGVGNGMGMGMGNQGFGNSDPMSQLYIDFRASFNEALTYAALAATVVAVALSLYLSRSVIAPVRAMSIATQRIADGRYDERVQVLG
ncbi:MAG: HAMP domain-containing protein [Chloroflexota bacterium]